MFGRSFNLNEKTKIEKYLKKIKLKSLFAVWEEI